MSTEQEDDLKAWLAVIKTVQPLLSAGKEPREFPSRLKVYAAPSRFLQNILDLHGLTVQEAYDTVRRFIVLHQKEGTKIISIITGKGIQGNGKIKKEILFWFETPFFREKISSFRWINGGGTIEIHLKKKNNLIPIKKE